jgi:hypothetical protein
MTWKVFNGDIVTRKGYKMQTKILSGKMELAVILVLTVVGISACAPLIPGLAPLQVWF